MGTQSASSRAPAAPSPWSPSTREPPSASASGLDTALAATTGRMPPPLRWCARQRRSSGSRAAATRLWRSRSAMLLASTSTDFSPSEKSPVNFTSSPCCFWRWRPHVIAWIHCLPSRHLRPIRGRPFSSNHFSTFFVVRDDKESRTSDEFTELLPLMRRRGAAGTRRDEAGPVVGGFNDARAPSPCGGPGRKLTPFDVGAMLPFSCPLALSESEMA
mmetsp:Transcript_89909/g.192814  ORF Transcript_89909/g.192814 Transcript_89909/m.192814 type:complete len:216 (-) Transcript_89909:8-655(-)